MIIVISKDTSCLLVNYINDRYDCNYKSYEIRHIHIADSIMKVTMTDDKTYNIPLREL